MAGLGGVHEEGGRAGGGERRGDLARDMARLAEPGDDDAALGLADQFDGGGKGRPERALQGRRDRGDAAGPGIERAQAPTARRRRVVVPDDCAISGFDWPCLVPRERGLARGPPP